MKRITLVTAILLLVCFVSSTSGETFKTEDANPLKTLEERALLRNEYGAPITDAFGQRFNYTQQELFAQSSRSRIHAQALEFSPDATPQIFIGAKPVWSYAAFGSGIGKSNIIVAKNGSVLEVYLGGSTATFGLDNYWYVLRHNPVSGDYDQVYVSAYYPSGIKRIEVADITGNAANEIIVALQNGNIHLFNQATRAWIGELTTTANGLEGLAVSDIDGDRDKELMLCTSNHLYVYSVSEGLEWD